MEHTEFPHAGERQIEESLWEELRWHLTNLNITPISWLRNSTSGYWPVRKECVQPPKDSYKNIYNNFILNIPELETAPIFTNRKKMEAWYFNNLAIKGSTFLIEKTKCTNSKDAEQQQQNPNIKDEFLYDSIYVKVHSGKISSTVKEMGAEAVLGSTVLTGKHREGLPGWWKSTLSGCGSLVYTSQRTNIACKVSGFCSMRGAPEFKRTEIKDEIG